MQDRPLPPTASFVQPAEGAKLFAPSAERNAGPIGDLLAQVAPSTGRALELASGTGQHVVAHAARLPGLTWQPTEVAPDRLASITAYVTESGLPNLLPPIELNATAAGWGTRHAGQALVLLVNLLHLIPGDEADRVIAEAAQALSPGGRLVVYGPFMRGGELTSEGDRTFDAALRAADPRIGYKDDFDTLDVVQAAGLEIVQVVEMPANNLAIVAERSAT